MTSVVSPATPLWTATEAAAAANGTARGEWTVDGVSIDTRTLRPGDLFVALKDVRDGHDFVAQALEKGAGAALARARRWSAASPKVSRRTPPCCWSRTSCPRWSVWVRPRARAVRRGWWR